MVFTKQAVLRDVKRQGHSKAVIIAALYATAILIALSGAGFTVYAFLKQIHFQVFNTSLPGFIFGLLVLYLGVRYALSVQKLKTNLYAADAQFSWSNFKRHKTAKGR